MSDAAASMSSNRPYLIRAMYEWISDNGMTPYLLVDAAQEGVEVPGSAVKDGKVVLNVAGRAVAQLELGNQWVSFKARFGGVSHSVLVPVSAVEAVYAHETGQGMMLPPDAESDAPTPEPPEQEPIKRAPHLRVVK